MIGKVPDSAVDAPTVGAGGDAAEVARSTRNAAATDHFDPHLIPRLGRSSAAVEQYRSLRENLMASSSGEPLRSILVASPNPGDGRSVTAANLGIVLAEDCQTRVLVLDADLREPGLHHLFGFDNQVGLADLLEGDAGMEEAVVATNFGQLHVLPGGVAFSNPTELLSSPALKTVLDRLTEVFDYVIIDTPPVVNVSDAAVVAPLTDAALLVVRRGETSRDSAAQALFLLQRVQANVVGTVVTHLRP